MQIVLKSRDLTLSASEGAMVLIETRDQRVEIAPDMLDTLINGLGAIRKLVPPSPRRGRPQKLKMVSVGTPQEPSIATPNTAPATPPNAPAPESKSPRTAKEVTTRSRKTPHLWERLDEWMRAHPGEHGLGELVEVVREGGWSNAPNLERAVLITLGKHPLVIRKVARNVFRRAEELVAEGMPILGLGRRRVARRRSGATTQTSAPMQRSASMAP